jgi:dihydropteroate synthase
VNRGLAAIVLGVGALYLADCSGAQDKAQAQLAAIETGCEVSLTIEQDAGEAGAVNATRHGCAAAIRAWDHSK